MVGIRRVWFLRKKVIILEDLHALRILLNLRIFDVFVEFSFLMEKERIIKKIRSVERS